ncbi:MAG: hypothetical protein ACTS6A_02370 [Candidatus Hodgkinia cicadicola]
MCVPRRRLPVEINGGPTSEVQMSARTKENFKPSLACSRSTSEASGPHCNLACFAPQSA